MTSSSFTSEITKFFRNAESSRSFSVSGNSTSANVSEYLPAQSQSKNKDSDVYILLSAQSCYTENIEEPEDISSSVEKHTDNNDIITIDSDEGSDSECEVVETSLTRTHSPPPVNPVISNVRSVKESTRVLPEKEIPLLVPIPSFHPVTPTSGPPFLPLTLPSEQYAVLPSAENPYNNYYVMPSVNPDSEYRNRNYLSISNPNVGSEINRSCEFNTETSTDVVSGTHFLIDRPSPTSAVNQEKLLNRNTGVIVENTKYAGKRSSKLFKCNNCDKPFISKSGLERHCKYTCPAVKTIRLQCRICDKLYSSTTGLKSHILNHHNIDITWAEANSSPTVSIEPKQTKNPNVSKSNGDSNLHHKVQSGEAIANSNTRDYSTLSNATLPSTGQTFSKRSGNISSVPLLTIPEHDILELDAKLPNRKCTGAETVRKYGSVEYLDIELEPDDIQQVKSRTEELPTESVQEVPKSPNILPVVSTRLKRPNILPVVSTRPKRSNILPSVTSTRPKRSNIIPETSTNPTIHQTQQKSTEVVESNSENIFLCNACGKKFPTIPKLVQHLQTHMMECLDDT